MNKFILIGKKTLINLNKVKHITIDNEKHHHHLVVIQYDNDGYTFQYSTEEEAEKVLVDITSRLRDFNLLIS